MPKHSICVFNSNTIADLRGVLDQAEYQTPDSHLTILKDGNDYFLRVSNADGDDPGDLNDSHVCPGSPGC
jgi:hypothetical protein